MTAGPVLVETNFRDVKINNFIVDSVEYVWEGGFGSMFYSIEKGNFKKDEVRIICGVLFKVWSAQSIYRKWLGWIFGNPKIVDWTPAMDVDAEWIRIFKKMVFGRE